MIIILLLLSRAGAEWVEISQQHYRKPLRTNFNFPVIEKVIDLPKRKTQTIYTNETLQEQVWSKGNIDKVPKLGNVQRVQLDTNPVKAPSLRGNSMTSVSAPFVHKNRGTSVMPIKAKQEDYNLDSSFEFNMETSAIDPVRKVEQYNAFKENTKGKIFEETGTGNKLKTDNLREQNKPTTNENVSNVPDSSKGKTETENITKGMKSHTIPPTTSAIDVFTNPKRASNQDNGHLKKTFNQRINQDNIKVVKGVLINPNSETDDFEATVENGDIRGDTVSNLPPTISFKDNEEQHIQNENIDQNNSATSDNNKANAIGNLIKFVKVVADTIRRNTRRSVNSKTRYLENLKESILTNIEDKIDAAWPDDDATPRHRRAAQASSRGHVQIPSSESALMTISFLTFAVFLIKLVLQVIQTYKNKSMMVAPTVVATVGRAARKRGKSKS